MAKKKADEIVEAVETAETVAEEIVESPVEPVKEDIEIDETEDFITRKLKAINQIEDRAKASRLAARVLRNRKGK